MSSSFNQFSFTQKSLFGSFMRSEAIPGSPAEGTTPYGSFNGATEMKKQG